MNVKRFVIAGIAVFVAMMILDFIFHMGLMGPVYEEIKEVTRSDSEMMRVMPIGYIFALLWSFLFCYIFIRGREGKGLIEGVRFGILMALFYSLITSIWQWTIYPIPFKLVIYWFLIGLVEMVILGILVAGIYKPVEETGATVTE
jgi:ABC-type multidrug transport system permease subunit